MSKEEVKKGLRLSDLPAHLQRKYKHSVLFEKEEGGPRKRFDFDLQKLKIRQAEKEKTIEEKLEEFTINATEEKYLQRVFAALAAPHGGKHFTEVEVAATLRRLGSRLSRQEIERMVWEFDDDLNRRITERQFSNMYKRCTIDPGAAESKNLFHLTQFLMYCRPDRARITVEDTLELLFVRARLELQRHGLPAGEKEAIARLEDEIQVLFEGQEKTPEGLEKEISFEQYLERINKRAVEKRRREIENAKSTLKYGSKLRDHPS